MSRVTTCDCGHWFECDDKFAGGYVNCPSCKKAVEVPGLRDPLWRLVQVGAVIGWLIAVWIGYVAGGGAAAVLAAVVGAGALWALSRLW